MWYFSWVLGLGLGLGLACSFAILNAMWLEIDQDAVGEDAVRRSGSTPKR
jgi:cytochrome bd-I ubiquinol oxidase subunit X